MGEYIPCIININMVLTLFFEGSMKKILLCVFLTIRMSYPMDLYYKLKEIVNSVNVNLVPSLQAMVENSTTLHGSIKNGQVEALEMNSRLGQLVNQLDPSERTPLHYAAINGNKAQIEWLLHRFAKSNIPDYMKQTPLHYAVIKGTEEAIQVLLSHMNPAEIDMKDTHGMTALHYAVCSKNSAIIRMLLQAGASTELQNKQGNTILHTIMQNNSTKVFEEFIGELRLLIGHANNNGEMPLHLAAAMGNIDFVLKLIEYGAGLEETSKKLWTPLFYAIHNNRHDIMRALRKRNAQTNCTDSEGRSPLCIAVEQGKAGFDILSELLADPTTQFAEEIQPVLRALDSGNFKGLDLLIKVGIDKEKKFPESLRKILDKNRAYADGKTALHHAVLLHYVEAVEFLIQNGAMIDCLDDLTITPFSYAVRQLVENKGDEKIINLLFGRATLTVQDMNGFDSYYYVIKSGNYQLVGKIRGIQQPQHILFQKWNIYGASLLHVAALFGKSNLIDYLINSGISVNQKDKNSETALHFAIIGMREGITREKYLAVIQALLRHKIDPKVKNRANVTALELAEKYSLNIPALKSVQ